jgi:signal transduction histidine kinase
MRILALAACVAAAVAVSFFMHDTVPPWTALVCVPLFGVSFLLGRRTSSAWPAAMFVVGVAGGLTGLGVVGLAVALPWFLGRAAYQQAALVAAGVEAAHLRERTRIAHEVHDTLGHELSLIALQAGALEMNLPEEHRAAAAALRMAASAATERLADLVFLLRDGDPPALVDLRDLVDRAVASGLRVEFTVEGQLPSVVERTVHRVVQEALTNAAKHAPKSLVVLRVITADATTVVEAGNDAGLRRGAGSRLGLIALRERVRLAGGTLRTSRDDGRFELVATLPHTGES